MTAANAAPRRVFRNARLIDPASGLDDKGAVLVNPDGTIADLGGHVVVDSIQEDIQTIDCGGHALVPGLVDMRVYSREPGDEYMETLKTLSRAAVAGGVARGFQDRGDFHRMVAIVVDDGDAAADADFGEAPFDPGEFGEGAA